MGAPAGKPFDELTAPTAAEGRGPEPVAGGPKAPDTRGVRSETPPTRPGGPSPARVHASFSGRVQGVGFRYTARALAERRGLVGFVSNVADGRVELEAEGSASEVRAYLEDIRRAFGRYIQDEEVRWLSPTGEYRRFEVRTSSGW